MATQLNELVRTRLPDGFTARPARMDDIAAAVRLFNLHSQSLIGTKVTSVEDVHSEWVSPGFTPERDILLVFNPDDSLVGYVEVWTTTKPPVHPWVWSCVHPDIEDNSVGTTLLTWAEERACQVLDKVPADLRVALNTGTYSVDEKAKDVYGSMGLEYFRSSFRMLIEMETLPDSPLWPEGIHLRQYDPHKDTEDVYHASVDAFRDHFGFIEQPFEDGFARFKHFMTTENYDPELWFLAMDGDEIAGLCLCRPKTEEIENCGYVSTLGVRRKWRRRGLGLAMLRYSFSEFYKRGIRKVALGVDAQNLTGALRLYEKAGMHVHQQFDLFEKELRPGEEISVQSLDE